MRVAGKVIVILVAFVWAGAVRAEDSFAQTPPAERAARLAAGFEAARTHRQALAAMLAYVQTRPDLWPPERPADPRLLPRADRETLWFTWHAILRADRALATIERDFSDFSDLKRGPDREDAFLLHRGAFLARYRFALEFIAAVERDPSLPIYLNDRIPETGLARNGYSVYKDHFLRPMQVIDNTGLRLAGKIIGGDRRPEWRAQMEEDAAAISQMANGRRQALALRNTARRVAKLADIVWLPVQGSVAASIGATKVFRIGRSLITPQQADECLARVQPGDILLTRREWFLSNLFLPGFWTHAAIVVGTPEERDRHFDDAETHAWVRAQGADDGRLDSLLAARYPSAYADSLKPVKGSPPRVIESVVPGVACVPFEKVAKADSLAVLRPRLPKVERAKAIVEAFRCSGRRYDFQFDFRTDSAFVCTELVYKCYEPRPDATGLHLAMVQRMGRPVLSANDVARQFAASLGGPAPEADLVLFLDGFEQRGEAVASTLDEFVQSCERTKWHVFLPRALPPPPPRP